MQTLPLSSGQVRFAGICYLIIILCGVGSEVAMRGPLIDFGAADGTAQAILAQAMRFRLSIMADVVMALADVTLAILLYWMFRPVSAGLALTAMVFRLMQSWLIAAGLLNLQAAVLLLETGHTEDSAEFALTFLAMHAYGYDLGLIFFWRELSVDRRPNCPIRIFPACARPRDRSVQSGLSVRQHPALHRARPAWDHCTRLCRPAGRRNSLLPVAPVHAQKQADGDTLTSRTTQTLCKADDTPLSCPITNPTNLII